MGKLVRRVLEGHEPVAEWSADYPASLERARARARAELVAGCTAVRADGLSTSPSESCRRTPR